MRQPFAISRMFWKQVRSDPFLPVLSPPEQPIFLPAARSTTDGLRNLQPSPQPANLEVGAGTGAVTQAIAEHMADATKLQIVEINERFVNCLRERVATEPCFHRVRSAIRIAHSSLENWSAARLYDIIVSSLPLNNFSVLRCGVHFGPYSSLCSSAAASYLSSSTWPFAGFGDGLQLTRASPTPWYRTIAGWFLHSSRSPSLSR